MALCICYSCKSVQEENSNGTCDSCEGQTGKIRDSKSCICSKCRRKIDCTGGLFPVCELCEVGTVEVVESLAKEKSTRMSDTVPDDRQILNILQKLHQNRLGQDSAYVNYSSTCRWLFSQGVYQCEHVSIHENEVTQKYKIQMEK